MLSDFGFKFLEHGFIVAAFTFFLGSQFSFGIDLEFVVLVENLLNVLEEDSRVGGKTLVIVFFERN